MPFPPLQRVAPFLFLLPLRIRRWLVAAAYALGALLLLMALAWAGMPWLLRWQIESRGTEKLGRVVTLQAVDFAPWALRTTLHGLAVAKAGGDGKGGHQLEVRRIEFRTALSSLWNGAPVIDSLKIESPHLVLAHRGGGHYDVDDVLQRLAEPDDPQRPPTRFALRHFQLSDGALDFDDRGKPHRLHDLVLDLPEISSLERDRNDPVQPRLAFVLDGSRFDSQAQATPFADLRKGEVALRFQGLDLAPYLDYLPADAPARLSAAVLDADLKISFAQPAAPAPRVLDISGILTARKLALTAPVPGVGSAAFAAEQLRVVIGHARPFAQEVAIDRVELTAPRLELHRGDAPKPAAANAGTGAAQAGKPAAAPAPAKASPAGAPAPGWKLALGHVAVRDGTVAWHDSTVGLPSALGLRGLSVDAGPAAWPLAAAVPLEVRTGLTGPTSATPTLALHGQAGLREGKVDITTAGLPLAWAGPYLKDVLRPALEGVLGTEATVAWSPAGVTADAKTVQLDRPALRQGTETLLGARQLLLAGAKVDTARHSAQVQRVALADPSGTITRNAQGVWMFEQWMAGGAPAGTASATAAAPTAPAAPAWQVALGTVEGQGGAFVFRDASRRRPVALDVSALRFTLTDMAWPPAPLAVKGKPASLDLALQVAASQATAGSLRYRGTVALAPMGLQGQVNAKRLPLGALEPYFGDALNVLVSRADVGFDGKIAMSMPPAGMQLQLDGDAAVEDGRVDSATPETPAASPADTVAPATAQAAATGARGALTAGARRASSLLSWKTLGLRGVSVSMVPGQPLRGSVGETTVSDFFARIAVDETGRINLSDVVRRAPGEAGAAPAGPAAPAVATPSAASDTALASGEGAGAPPASTAATAVAPQPPPAGAQLPVAAVPAAEAAGNAPILRFGPTRIVNGRVEFADRFIKPNYSASLSELNGSLGGFASVPDSAAGVQMAALELRGKAEGTASLEITGKLNPLAKPLALDIVGKVRDLDLPALSPYAVKYSGHGIERGKLSMDVAYQVQPDGRLTAKNSLVLHQLTFGEPVAGAPASLPVQLAVALLADRNGVIDLDLPISGSLNDPQFSLGPVIGKALLNLLVKAVTSPFSLLAHAFGGEGAAAQASVVAFEPGSSGLSPAAREQLDKVAQVLVDKPALQVTVAGTASLAAEADGYRRQRLLQLARFEKRRKLLAGPQAVTAAGATASGAATADGAGADVTVSPEEYPELLRQVYARADMPKPRNMIGLAKELPVDEMERLMMAQIDVDAATMQAVAVQRGGAVRDYLAARGVPADRLFLGAPRQVDGTGDWSPRAELKLAAR